MLTGTSQERSSYCLRVANTNGVTQIDVMHVVCYQEKHALTNVLRNGINL